jgi:hypothetical protein
MVAQNRSLLRPHGADMRAATDAYLPGHLGWKGSNDLTWLGPHLGESGLRGRVNRGSESSCRIRQEPFNVVQTPGGSRSV